MPKAKVITMTASAQQHVGEPPDVGAEAQGELVQVPDHVGPAEVQRQGQYPERGQRRRGSLRDPGLPAAHQTVDDRRGQFGRVSLLAPLRSG